MAAKTFVDQKVGSKKVVVFSKRGCPFCTMASKVFQDLIKEGKLSTEDYEDIDIGNMKNCQEIQDHMMERTKGRSVPRVFVNGKCIGGGSEAQAMYKSGQLATMLTS